MNNSVVGVIGARTALTLAIPAALVAAGAIFAAAPAGAATSGAATAAPSCTIHWVGKGAQPAWTDPQNWSTGKLPGPADDVCITSTGDDVITNISIKVHSIQIGRSQGIALEGSASNPVTATIATSIGTDGGISRIDMTDATIRAAQINLDGTTIFTNGTCNLISPDVAFNNSDLEASSGTTTLTGLPQLSNGTLTNARLTAAEATLVIPGDITHLVSALVTVGQGAAIVDAAGHNALSGLASVDARSTLTDFNDLTLTSSFTADGSVSFGGGTIAVAGPFNQAQGTLLLESGTTLSASTVMVGHSATLEDGGSITGNLVNDGSLQLNPAADVTGNYTQAANASLVAGFTGTLRVTGKATLAGSVTDREVLAHTGDTAQLITFGSLSGNFTSHLLGLRLITKANEIDAIELPQILVSPVTAAAGQTLIVTGGGFTYPLSVSIFLDHVGGTPLGTATVGPFGTISTTVTIPAATAAGTHRLIAVASDGNRASAAITTS